MKPIYLQFAAAFAASLAIGNGSVLAQSETSWNDVPQTSGDWAYVDERAESLGLFGDANPVHLFVLRCDKQSRMIGIARRGNAEGAITMRLRTETRERVLEASQVPDYGLVAANLPANDALFDAMAVTKGRFAVEVEGMEPLYIPAWAEVTRVIEDCR